MFKAKVIKSFKVEEKTSAEGRKFTKSDFVGEIIEATPRSYIGKQINVKTYHNKQFNVGDIVSYENAVIKDYVTKDKKDKDGKLVPGGQVVEFFQTAGALSIGGFSEKPSDPYPSEPRQERNDFSDAEAVNPQEVVEALKNQELVNRVKVLEQKMELLLTSLEKFGSLKSLK